MTPLDLVLWTVVGGLALVAGSVFVALAILVVRAALQTSRDHTR